MQPKNFLAFVLVAVWQKISLLTKILSFRLFILRPWEAKPPPPRSWPCPGPWSVQHPSKSRFKAGQKTRPAPEQGPDFQRQKLHESRQGEPKTSSSVNTYYESLIFLQSWIDCIIWFGLTGDDLKWFLLVPAENQQTVGKCPFPWRRDKGAKEHAGM